MSVKPKKRIAIVDCGSPPHAAQGLLNLINEDYDIEITDDFNADYVIHSCMGYKVLKYSGIRIYVCGECVSPNFNTSDYAAAFDRMVYDDRNHWFPLIKLYVDAYAVLKNPRPPADEIINQKSDFCAYVMSNTKYSSDERAQIFDLLNAYKTVSSGGKWQNNVGGPVANKLEFQTKHKFAIAFENNSHPGYLTEKFAEAAQAGSIPIYWGDPEIGSYFNSKAFINCHDYPTLDEAVSRVIEIDQDEALYRQMLVEPWFPNNTEPKILSGDSIKSFLKNIFDQPRDAAYRRNRSRWGMKYEKSLYKMNNQPLLQLVKQMRNALRRKDTI
jgi:hypothetical protein